ncbi:MAG: PQQ-dependent sugar dehydrogenase [Bacteroidia bacterium]|nr:PQQ-dependent sugar dehydrogenase [Bacteroidia bacterium]
MKLSKLLTVRRIAAISALVFLLIAFGCNTAKKGSRWQNQKGNITYYDESRDFAQAEKNYQNYCSGCHGSKMQAFVDRVWQHGMDRESLFSGIKNGYPADGMPAFDTTFTDDEVKELVDFVLKALDYQKQFSPELGTPGSDTFTTEVLGIQLDTLLFDKSEVEIPWGMEFLPNGDMLVTDRGGLVYRLSKDGKLHLISGSPKVRSRGQGGMLDIELHPNFKENSLVYMSYSKPQEGGTKVTTAIVRAKYEADAFTELKEIFEGSPYWGTHHHFGSRLEFDKEGYLYFSMGDRGKRDINPQNLDNHGGKIHRINDDGSIPKDNPFVGREGAMPSIYSYGHRNPQGLAMHPKTGKIWEHEHGPRGGDELNKIMPGENYGWPVISYGINYNGTTFTEKTEMEGMLQPELYWIPSIAACGMTFIKSDKYPGWEDDIIVGSLRFNYLVRVIMEGDSVKGEEIIMRNIGRVRNVEMGPDGYLYVGTENPGAIFRMMPFEL